MYRKRKTAKNRTNFKSKIVWNVGEEDKVMSMAALWVGPSSKNHDGKTVNTCTGVRIHDGWKFLHDLVEWIWYNKVCYLSVCRLLKRIFLTEILSQITI